MRTSILVLVMTASMAVTASAANAAGDATKGYEVAKSECSRCHNVEKGGAFKQRPPSFQAIAIYRTADDIWSRIIAPSPHSGMPDVKWGLIPNQMEDLVAYIASLDNTVPLAQ